MEWFIDFHKNVQYLLLSKLEIFHIYIVVYIIFKLVVMITHKSTHHYKFLFNIYILYL